ncbi:hypothetical protein [Ponticoccus litoralis]|uniref:Uncharacterized protein n=1 Tax=Ponticoccus litoralis TaxID=422297 RepID=A0AAW9SNF8_9RHOB
MTDSNIGWTLFFSPSLPATNDAAGFEALNDWEQVTGLQTAPQFGVSHSNVDVDDLATGFAGGVKGAGAGNDSTFTFHGAHFGASASAGVLAAVASAEGSDTTCSLKKVKGSGADGGRGVGKAPAPGDPVQYAQGYLHTFAGNQEGVDTHEGGSINFKQNDFTVKGTEPVA